MVKQLDLKIIRQKKRSTIQILAQKYPEMKNSDIAEIVGTSKMTVSRWKNKANFTDKKRKRKTKMTKEIKCFLIQKAKNKFSGINNASCRKLSKEIKNQFNISISYGTVNRWLLKLFNKPIKAKKTFFLRKRDKKRRLEFAQMLSQKNISGKNIFFTDEKRFILNPPINKQTNQIRLDSNGYKEYQSGQGELFEKIARPIKKFPQGIMVAAGLSRKGVGKLIFVTGTMNSFSYLQTLELYKEDIEKLDKNLFLQQDNAPCHVGKKCMEYIKLNFTNHLEFWPPNSPDLSPIEELWAIVEEKLNSYTFNSLEEMTTKLQWVWNRIPKKICSNLINSFDKKIELLKQKHGERVNKRKHLTKESNYTWKNCYNDDDNFRIVYNEKILEIMRQKKIKTLNKQLKEIKESFTEEKKRYSAQNKELIKKESKSLYSFFLKQEEEMKRIYGDKIIQKENEISFFQNLEGKELFNRFSLEEKINNIKLNNKSKVLSNISTNVD